ncbi:hypothetical protein EG68_10636 [Paragonimus skrjabini miyazakii]|uniref:BLOC-1-related complex subunit 5 n=1 Tax=Paragonimus skrjabini miyazakii TaxID=59628 RepID=A0A8S9Y8G5_9TREM|nr:hypothetical protein EG68_10636 [Paragonimus skrjabini miyazakii]
MNVCGFIAVDLKWCCCLWDKHLPKMGSDQSTISAYDSSIAFHSDGPTSLPSSPQREVPSESSNNLSGYVYKSLSSSDARFTHRSLTNLSNADGTESWTRGLSASLNRPASMSTVALSTQVKPHAPSRSASVTTTCQGGIVVVCPGPIQRFATTGSLDAKIPRNVGDQAALVQKKLRQIPVFTLPATASSVQGSRDVSGSFLRTGKQFCPTLHQVDSHKLTVMVERYSQFVEHCAELVYQDQLKVIGLQNKVDYEVRRLTDDLRARETGVRLSPTTLSKVAVQKDLSVLGEKANLAGSKQVDSIVLQTSQISGLINQSFNALQQLSDSLNQLNQLLPESKQLPHFKIDFAPAP